MAEPKPPTHLEAEDILLAMDTAPNIEEHVRRLLLYIRAAEQMEKERDELKAKLREHSDTILEALALAADDASPEFKAAVKAVEEAIK